MAHSFNGVSHGWTER